MILRLLRLFAQYRALELQIAELATARISAEDRERLWRSRSESAEQLRDKALDEKERNHKMMANWMALYYGSPSVPFPEVFVSPLREEPEVEPQPRKQHASERMRELDREFREQFSRNADREYDSFS